MSRYVEPLVDIAELYSVPNRTSSGVSYHPGGTEPPEVLERVYGVKVVLDHRDQPAVTFSDACKIRDARKAAAEEMRASFLAESHHAERVAAWQRSREEFWQLNRLRVGRQIGPNLEASAHLAEISHRLSVEILAHEAAAGIPADIQRHLAWPSPLSWTEPDNKTDVSYHPPATTEGN